MKRIVIDASVALKWFLPDEEYGTKALKLLGRYISGQLEMVAPSLLEYEVMNGLLIAGRRGRIKDEIVLLAAEGFMDLEIPLRDVRAFYPRIIEYSRTLALTAYDASYLALAEVEGCALVTADRRLFESAHESLKWVKWIGEA